MRKTCTFPSVSPPCLFSLIAFEIRCIGRVLLVLGSRLKGSSLQGVTVTRVHNRFGGMRDLAFFRGDIRDLS